MDSDQAQQDTQKHLWRQANVRLLPSAILGALGIFIVAANRNARDDTAHKLIVLSGIMMFVVFAITFLRVFTETIYQLISFYLLRAGRATVVRFVLRIVGYITIFLTTLDLLGVPVGKLLLGGAAVGIILGVAAQQALANFFASVVLIVARPFSVGEHVTLNSGALGGTYVGEIKDIGLTHTGLKEDSGHAVLLSNSTILSGAAVLIEKRSTKHD